MTFKSTTTTKKTRKIRAWSWTAAVVLSATSAFANLEEGAGAKGGGDDCFTRVSWRQSREGIVSDLMHCGLSEEEARCVTLAYPKLDLTSSIETCTGEVIGGG